MKHGHITTLLVLGALLGHAGQVHAQRPRIERPPQKSPEERYEDLKKSPLLAAMLEWIIPVSGHGYAGDMDAGAPSAALMVLGGLTFSLAALVGMAACVETLESPPATFCDEFGIVAKAGALTILGSRIWASVSAWRLANRTNAFYRRYLGLDHAGLALSLTPGGRFGLGVSLRF